MNSRIEITKARLGDCLCRVIDYRGKTPPKSSSGIPALSAAHIKKGRVDLSGITYVSEETYEEWTTRGLPQAGDVLITTEAPVGEVALLPSDQTYLLTRRIFSMGGTEGILNNRYLLYSLLSDQIQNQLKEKERGSTVPRILKPDIFDLEIPLPPIFEQEAIASILGALDEKIELNKNNCETLEEIAKTLFKSWFINFDPVRKKSEGNATELPDEIDDLLPDSFEQSELGEIPTGWSWRPLDKVANYLNGLALQKFPPKGDGKDLPVIKIAQLRKGDTIDSDKCSDELGAEYVIEDGDVLFSWSGSLLVDIWTGATGALNQHLFKVTSKDFEKWFYYWWTKYHLGEFQSIAKSKATTMGHIQRKHLSEAMVAVPPEEVLLELNKVFAPILSRQIHARLESRTLTSVRDALLRPLISGELRIPDAEKMLEEAGI